MIEAGQMVEVINASKPWNQKYIGHIGRVLEIVETNHGWPAAVVEGVPTSPGSVGFLFRNLRPIKDDDASWDNEVWKTIGWKPKQEVTCDA